MDITGPVLVNADQINALPIGSIVEIVEAAWSTVYIRKGGHWSGTNGGHIYDGRGFPIGKTYLVRPGPLK